MPAWAAALAAASALIAAMELTPGARGCGIACAFPVLDAIPPQAKLSFGALLGALMWLARRWRPTASVGLMICDAAAGAMAAALVLALLPDGFGIKLFDTVLLCAPNVLYVVSAIAGGLLGTLLDRSCRHRIGSE